MNLLLLDDHSLFAKSLEISLKNHVQTFGSFTQPHELLAHLKDNPLPDILLLDINLKDSSGLDLASQLLKQYPDLKIIFLSGFDLPEYHQQAINLGAKAFLSKDVSLEELLKAFAHVLAGGSQFPDSRLKGIPLTEREKEVLQLSAEGLTQKDISETLFIATRTVANHCTAIREKLDVNSMNAALVRGIELGIIRVRF